MRNMLLRALDAALLKRGVYREAGDDPQAILHALGIVMFAGIGVGIGLTGLADQGGAATLDSTGLANRIVGLWVAITTLLIGWIVWVLLAYLLGSKVMRGHARYRQLLRALGICYGPAVLMLFISVPRLGDAVPVVGIFWVLVAGVAAMHEVQELDWVSSLLATAPGWFLSFWVLQVAFFSPFIA